MSWCNYSNNKCYRSLSKKIYDNFHNNLDLSSNQNLCDVRMSFDKYNLISGLHTLMAEKNSIYEKSFASIKIIR